MIKENPLSDGLVHVSDWLKKQSNPDVLFVMMTDVHTDDEAMTEMERKINILIKAVEE